MPQSFLRLINSLLILLILGAFALEATLLLRFSETKPAVAQGQSGTPEPKVFPEEAQTFPADEYSKCVTRMKDFMHGKHTEFGEFMNNHFRSQKPTSELIFAAVERFRQYREEIRSEMRKFSATNKTELSAASSELPGCQKAIDEDFVLMKQLIRSHILENASAKKSTRLLDKYKEINEKLDALNFTIGQMAGFFGTFAQKLPCYATKCVKG